MPRILGIPEKGRDMEIPGVVRMDGDRAIFRGDYLPDNFPMADLDRFLPFIPTHAAPEQRQHDRLVARQGEGRQIVHDSGVVQTTLKSYREIKEALAGGPPPDTDQAFREITEAVQNLPKGMAKADATRVIETISRFNSASSALGGEKEMDVLANVWAYAGAKEERKFLRESIIDSLTKAVEEPGGSVVCVMGRIAQTIGSLAGLDAAVKIAPQYAILREVSARAGVIHAELLGAMSENDRRVVQEDEGEIANALANGLKSDLRARLKEEYVASGLLKEKVFARETAWIDTLY